MARAWNETAPERARVLNRVAKRRADLQLRRRGIDQRGGKLVHAWEHQKRGALHQHFLVGMGTAEQDAWGTNVDGLWARLYGEALHELAPKYGFGFVDTKPLYVEAPKPAREAAAYLSGYFIVGRGKKAAITETVRSRDVPALVVYVSPKLTRQTFCTMRNLRRSRRLFMWRCGVAVQPTWSEAELLEVRVVLDRLPTAVAARAPPAMEARQWHRCVPASSGRMPWPLRSGRGTLSVRPTLRAHRLVVLIVGDSAVWSSSSRSVWASSSIA
jgi:hypothetical protein